MRCPWRLVWRHYSASLAALFIPCSVPANAETLEQIKGLSVKVEYKVQAIRVDDAGRRFNMTADAAIHFYLSTKGNLFLYPGGATIHQDSAPDVRAEGGPTVMPIDKAGEQKFGQMNAWTMMNGHLTNIIKFIRGYAVTTVAIDPERLTCTFDRQYQPDPQTGTVVSNLTGPATQIEGYKVASYSCAVTRGNVFAPMAE
jgi:hypothetical protein